MIHGPINVRVKLFLLSYILLISITEINFLFY